MRLCSKHNLSFKGRRLNSYRPKFKSWSCRDCWRRRKVGMRAAPLHCKLLSFFLHKESIGSWCHTWSCPCCFCYTAFSPCCMLISYCGSLTPKKKFFFFCFSQKCWRIKLTSSGPVLIRTVATIDCCFSVCTDYITMSLCISVSGLSCMCCIVWNVFRV